MPKCISSSKEMSSGLGSGATGVLPRARHHHHAIYGVEARLRQFIAAEVDLKRGNPLTYLQVTGRIEGIRF